MDANEVARILKAATEVDRARIASGNSDAPFDFQIVTLKLEYGVAREESNAMQLSVPFKTVYVLKSTHPALKIKLKPNTNSTYQSAIELTEKDVLSFGSPIAKAFVFWEAQSASGTDEIDQEVTLLLSVNAEFKSGSLSSVRGGIKTDVYNSFTCAKTTLAGATATLITSPGGLGALGQNQQWLIQNISGGDIWLGSSTLTDADGGIKIADGDSFRWNNLSDLYAYSVGGGDVMVLREF